MQDSQVDRVVRSNCEEARELIGAYSIGATDAAETQLVETALVDCPELAEELADYAALNDALNRAVPQRFQAPPAHKILAGLQEPSASKVISMTKPAASRRALWWSIAALFAVTVLAVGSNLYWFGEVGQLRQQATPQVTPQLTPPVFPVALRPQDSHHRRLTATTTDQPTAQAEVIWNSDIEVGALYATGLQQLEPDMAYQFWGVNGDTAISLGQFTVDADGTGFLIFQSPQPVASFDALGISPEPASGSAQPTHEHIVVGKV